MEKTETNQQLKLLLQIAKELRIYLWAKKYDFVVILGKQKKPEGYQLITSYCTNDPDTLYRFEKQSCEYPDPRKS